jgi:nucleoside-diphosphate-sugar epimerase
MRCLVTGASGFLGSHLTRELVRRGHIVTILLRPTSKTLLIDNYLGAVRVVYGEMQNLSGLKKALDSEPVDAAFHLAWYGVTAKDRNDSRQITHNVKGSLDLWEILHQSGCSTWIGLGSQAEYGPHAGVLREDTVTNPKTAYGVAKLAVGQLTQQLCTLADMRYIWLRLLSAYGPGDDENHMIPSMIRALMAGQKPRVTAGEQLWDYIYVTDAVEAFCALLESSASGVLNVGSGSATPLRKTMELLRDRIDPNLEIGFGEIPYATDQVMHLEADISRLRAATGWEPKVSLEEGLRRTVEWYKTECQNAGSR